MSNQVFSQPAMNTPVLSPGWTVQNAATGSNQNLTANLGAASGESVGSPVATNNFLAQSLQLEDVSVSAPAVMPSGTLVGAKVIVNDDIESFNGTVYVGAAGSAYTTTHGWLVLVDANGDILAQTADLTTAFGTASVGVFTKPWASPVNLTGGQYYVAAVLVGSGTTAPKLAGAYAPSALLNLNLAAVAGGPGSATPGGSFRFADLATGISTALPSSVTMTSITADNTIQLFAALS